MPVAIKRYTLVARHFKNKPQRYQRTYPTVDDARKAALRWLADPDVKAVWVFDNGEEVLHEIHRIVPDDLPEPGNRCKTCGREVTWIGPGSSDWEHADG